MFLNYIKTAFRNIVKNKLFSTVHITGLSIGLAGSFIMLLIVIHEYSYDTSNDKLDRIYRVRVDIPQAGKSFLGSPYPLAEEIALKLPGILETARGMELPVSVSCEGDNERFSENKAFSADNNLGDILTIPMVTGGEKKAPGNSSILISENIAEKYFTDENPLGKMLEVKCGGKNYPLMVAGVFKNFPETSTLQTEYIVPINIAEDVLNKRYAYRGKEPVSQWDFFHHLNVFVLAEKGIDAKTIQKNMPKFSDYKDTGTEMLYILEPYSEVHLNSDYDNGTPFTVKQETVNAFFGISMIILLIATFNFILLSITRLRDKSREAGIRKVLGAGKKDIIYLVLAESVIYSLLSLPVTLFLVSILNRYLPEMLNITISGNYLFNAGILSLFILLTVISGIVSGLYTAIILSRKTPLAAINTEKFRAAKPLQGKQVLLGVQMVILICMMFLSLGVRLQTGYFREKDLGFNPDNLLIVNLSGNADKTKYRSYKSSLTTSPFISNVSAANMLPPLPRTTNTRMPSMENPDVLITVDRIGIDEDFIETMGIKLLSGSNIYTGSNENRRKFIFNREAAKVFNLGNERYIKNAEAEITGIIENFNYAWLNQKVAPLALNITDPEYFQEMIIRYTPGSEQEAVNLAKSEWEKFFPGKNFDYYFMDDKFAQVYKNEYNFAQLITFATLLSIFISCMGLFGYTVFTVKQKTKEIGIRKVLGASLADIVIVLTKKIFLLVTLASIGGLLIGNYLLSLWLQEFVYRINIRSFHYILVVISVAAIVFFTMAIYIVRYYYSAPAKSIRYE